MTVWVLEYDHKHGTSVSVWEEERDALSAMARLAKEWRADFDVNPNLSDDDVASNWFEHTGGLEAMRLSEARILGAKDAENYTG